MSISPEVPENYNPELLPGETPLEDRLADAATDVAAATARFVAIQEPCESCGRRTATPVSDACSASIDLGRAVLKAITVLRQEPGDVCSAP